MVAINQRVLVALVTILFLTNSYAITYYRHLPFHLTLTPEDNVVVDYDFSGSRGISCSATQPVTIQFGYKGNHKIAALPIKLISDHVPDKREEELADVSGQFNLTTVKDQTPSRKIELACGFLGE